VLAWSPKAATRGSTFECKSLAENGDKLKTYQTAYCMASVDPLEDTEAFAKTTSVKLGDQVVTKKEADSPILSDPTKQVATAVWPTAMWRQKRPRSPAQGRLQATGGR
jgi:thioredoxin-dependent peroxiredoxin